VTASYIQPATPATHHRFHFLDALRGLAALLVITLHAPGVFIRTLFMSNAYLAVDFFFCLSGFVIAFSYEKRLSTSLTLRDFTIARLIRLYPLAALGTTIGLVGTIATHLLQPTPESWLPLVPQALCGFALVPDIFISSLHFNLFPLDFMMWTLFFELLANFAYAALVKCNLAGNWLLLSLASAAFLGLAAVRLKFGTLNLGVTFFTAPVALLRVSVSFCLGILVYRLYQRFKRKSLTGGMAILAALTIATLFLAPLSGAKHFMTTAPWELGMVAPFFPAVIFIGAHISLPSAWTNLCTFLGNISYPLYILHGPLLWPLLRPGPCSYASTHATNATIILALYTAFLIFIAWLAGHVYDAPIRIRLTRMIQRTSQTLTTSSI
jgi:peptidoglycan/LPS O-acetylase OafA/YrhL